jgi:O-antigen ligase
MLAKHKGDQREPIAPARGPNMMGRVLNKILFCGLLAVIPIAVIPYGTVDAWWEAVFECSVFALTALWAIEVLLTRNWYLRGFSILLPVTLLTVYAFLQTVAWPPTWLMHSSGQHMLTIDHYQTYLTARKLLALALFMMLLLGHASSVYRLRWTKRMLIAVGVGSAVFGILRQFLQPDDATGGFLLPFLFYGVGYAQFISPNPFAYLMEMTIGLLRGLILGGGALKKHTLLYLALMVVVWTALVLCTSRGGLLGLACESVFLVFIALNWYAERSAAQGNASTRLSRLVRQSKVLHVIAIMAMLGILAVGVVWMGGEQLASKVANQPSTAARTDGQTRQEIWRASWRLFKDKPWTGTGFGAYFLGITRFETSSGRTRLVQAHNDYLDLAANGGLIGIALGGWLIVAVIRRASRRLRGRDHYARAAALGAAAGALAVAAHSVVDFGLQVTGIAVVFVGLIVIMVADPAPEKKKPQLKVAHNLDNELRPST